MLSCLSAVIMGWDSASMQPWHLSEALLALYHLAPASTLDYSSECTALQVACAVSVRQPDQRHAAPALVETAGGPAGPMPSGTLQVLALKTQHCGTALSWECVKLACSHLTVSAQPWCS